MPEQHSTSIPPLLNRFMGALLRSPFHGSASRSVMLITFTGRKSGRPYATPVSYHRDGERVIAFTEASWWRNLVGGAPVALVIKRTRYHGRADVVAEDKDLVAEKLAALFE